MISEHENTQVDTSFIPSPDMQAKLDEFVKASDEIIKKTQFVKKYSDALTKVTERYQRTFLESPTGAIHRLYVMYEKFNIIGAALYDAALRKATEISKTMLAAFSAGMKAAAIVARIITAPGSWFLFYFLKKWANRYKTPILAEGVHLILATMGGGKSSIMFDVMEELRRLTGFGSSVNTDLENPKYNKITHSFFRHHDFFDMWDKFGLEEVTNKYGETRFIATLREQFNPDFLAALVFDEFISALNRRNNKSTDYNKVFLAIFNLVLHKRHVSKKSLKSGIKRVYFLQQIDALDGLLNSAIDYKHYIKVDLDCSYPYWLLTGALTKFIKGWDVWTYVPNVKRNRKGGKDDWKLKKHYYRKKTFRDEDFESRNQGEFYDNLPIPQTKYNKQIERAGGAAWT